MSIKCGRCGGKHKSVNEVRMCGTQGAQNTLATVVEAKTSGGAIMDSLRRARVAANTERDVFKALPRTAPKAQETRKASAPISTSVMAPKPVESRTPFKIQRPAAYAERLAAARLLIATQRKLDAATDLKAPIYVKAIQKAEADEDAAVAAFKAERWDNEAQMDAPEDILPVTEDGMYRDPNGTIFKVQYAVHGSGQLYAKELVELEFPEETRKGVRTHEFVYAPGAIKRLTAGMRMTLAEAKEWGALYGTCCRCGITLTDERSIAAGIGPICGSKGWA